MKLGCGKKSTRGYDRSSNEDSEVMTMSSVTMLTNMVRKGKSKHMMKHKCKAKYKGKKHATEVLGST